MLASRALATEQTRIVSEGTFSAVRERLKCSASVRKRGSDEAGAARFGQLVSELSGQGALCSRDEVDAPLRAQRAVENLLDLGALAAARVPAAGCRHTIAHGACIERGGVIACRRHALTHARPKRLLSMSEAAT